MNKKKIVLAVESSLHFLIRTYLRKFDYTLIDYQKIMGMNPDLIIFTKKFMDPVKKFLSDSNRASFLMIGENDNKNFVSVCVFLSSGRIRLCPIRCIGMG